MKKGQVASASKGVRVLSDRSRSPEVAARSSVRSLSREVRALKAEIDQLRAQLLEIVLREDDH